MATKKFDKNKGFKFSTFASTYIWGYMSHYRRLNISSIKTPRKMIDNQEYIYCESLNVVSGDGEEDNREMQDFLEGNITNWDNELTRIDFEEKLKCIGNERNKQIFLLLSKEYTQNKIAKMTCQQKTGQIIAIQ